MAIIELSMVVGSIVEMGVEAIWDKAKRREAVIKALRKADLSRILSQQILKVFTHTHWLNMESGNLIPSLTSSAMISFEMPSGDPLRREILLFFR